MRYYGGGYPRRTCLGMVVQVMLVMFLGIVALICIANRSWFEARAMDAIYGDRARIHEGASFRPGATAEEDGVRYTAVLIGEQPYVQVKSPPSAWRRAHSAAECARDVCTEPASRLEFAGSSGFLGGVLPLMLAGWIMWTMIGGDSPTPMSRQRDGYYPGEPY